MNHLVAEDTLIIGFNDSKVFLNHYKGHEEPYVLVQDLAGFALRFADSVDFIRICENEYRLQAKGLKSNRSIGGYLFSYIGGTPVTQPVYAFASAKRASIYLFCEGQHLVLEDGVIVLDEAIQKIEGELLIDISFAPSQQE